MATLCHLFGSCTEGGRKHERANNGPRGGRAIARLTVWWQLGDSRASEFMDFDGAGRVVRSEAFYGK